MGQEGGPKRGDLRGPHKREARLTPSILWDTGPPLPGRRRHQIWQPLLGTGWAKTFSPTIFPYKLILWVIRDSGAESRRHRQWPGTGWAAWPGTMPAQMREATVVPSREGQGGPDLSQAAEVGGVCSSHLGLSLPRAFAHTVPFPAIPFP